MISACASALFGLANIIFGLFFLIGIGWMFAVYRLNPWQVLLVVFGVRRLVHGRTERWAVRITGMMFLGVLGLTILDCGYDGIFVVPSRN